MARPGWLRGSSFPGTFPIAPLPKRSSRARRAEHVTGCARRGAASRVGHAQPSSGNFLVPFHRRAPGRARNRFSPSCSSRPVPGPRSTPRCRGSRTQSSTAAISSNVGGRRSSRSGSQRAPGRRRRCARRRGADRAEARRRAAQSARFTPWVKTSSCSRPSASPISKMADSSIKTALAAALQQAGEDLGAR